MRDWVTRIAVALAGFAMVATSMSLAVAPQASAVAAAPPSHFVVIFLENKSYTTVASHFADIPYLKTFQTNGIRFSNYKEGNATGPSLPDYLQVAAGSSCGSTNDSVVAGQFGAAQGCPTTVWNQLSTAGVSWHAYMDAMPSACYGGTGAASAALQTTYALRHNAATPFASIWGNQTLCKANVLPGKPLATGLPAVSFAAPGICDDLHGMTTSKYPNCVKTTNGIYIRANAWLTNVVPPLLSAGATVLITFDESGTLYAVEDGPGIRAGQTINTAFTHYSVLAAIENAYGLSLLGGARTATPIPLTAP